MKQSCKIVPELDLLSRILAPHAQVDADEECDSGPNPN